MHGGAADWGLAEQLLATVVDVLQVGNWQRAADKRARRPEPLERPGVKRSEPRRSQLSDAEKLERLKAMGADQREG